jgi:hypothetical protein
VSVRMNKKFKAYLAFGLFLAANCLEISRRGLRLGTLAWSHDFGAILNLGNRERSGSVSAGQADAAPPRRYHKSGDLRSLALCGHARNVFVAGEFSVFSAFFEGRHTLVVEDHRVASVVVAIL